jgi:hypothetical protein
MYLHLFQLAIARKEIQMNPQVPGFLFPFLSFSTFATLAALLFGLNRSLTAANWPAHDRGRAIWGGAAFLAAFYLAALLPARSGFYASAGSKIPTIQFGLLIPIVAGILMFFLWSPFRRVIEAVPQQWLVGVQLYRTLGVIFLVLYAIGRLPAVFAVPAGAGDVLVGLLAPLVATAQARKWRNANALLRAWNLLGLADLVVALTTGFLTSPSPLQRFAFDAPNVLITRYPLVIVPVFLVPLAILLHLASLQKLRQTENAQTTRHPIFIPERG